ncbi:poly-gamma-glutamate hydrolase family protein [Peribacillus huizhouensis]|uniref:Uncharacterized protein n=1 Tax=Peribacillus huizhouensis TaxID=1501239 RepID=A0ABR6CUW2_9BACI|nr:poly-gamma-glutamate hydrolase family protein [Peribacillus huizhouensis]MBA9028822.1 hypothetical protein [Peribacillus huizhouensis]
MADTYANYKELAAVEVKGVDYDIRSHKVNGSKTIIFTPHGGDIEQPGLQIGTKHFCRILILKVLEFVRCLPSSKRFYGLHLKYGLLHFPQLN